MTTTSRFRIIRTAELAEMLGVSRVTLWRWERQGRLPPKRQLGPNAVGWIESEILEWIDTRPLGSMGHEVTTQPRLSDADSRGGAL